jgi:DNA-binding NtrC family response regulator
VIRDPAVSRLHAELSLVSGGVQLADLGSRNGVFYLGQRVQRITLGLGTRVRLANVDVAIDPASAPSDPVRDRCNYGKLFGTSPALRRLVDTLVRLESSLASVLIEGESGTGKELVARAIHEHSAVARGPFVVLNCGGLDRNLARAELFGARRGAYTGAVDSRVGAFEEADGGSLFLDEIGELPLDVQPVLLRALENQAVARVGDTRERPVRVRVLAATNRHLDEEVRTGRFREDLFYRLNVACIRVPSLRERRDDIEPLAHHFAEQLGSLALPPELLATIRRRLWPGNVRELKNAVQAYLALGVLSPSRPIGAGDLSQALRGSIGVGQPYEPQKRRLLEEFTRTYLELLLEQTGGNQSEAARISGLDRSHLNKTLARIKGSRD